MGRLHVLPNGANNWAVRQERDGGIVGEYPTKEEAEAAARATGASEVLVHDRFERTQTGRLEHASRD